MGGGGKGKERGSNRGGSGVHQVTWQVADPGVDSLQLFDCLL